MTSRFSRAHPVAALAVVLVLAGCSGSDEGEPSTTAEGPPATSKAPLTVPSTTGPTGVVSAPEAVVESARIDAAEVTGAAPDDVNVVSARAVVWPDTGLGCAAPGTSVAQVLTNGYWVVLQVGDRVLDYRSGPDELVRVCTDGVPPVDVIVDQ